MANVYDVADFFIELAGQDEEGEITNLKLNKLLYYAQGHYLAKTGKPLFDDDIEAWDLGPVVPAVYQKYKICGRNNISAIDKELAHLFTDEEYNILLDSAREYCKYTAAYLVNKTHVIGSPWERTVKGEIIDKTHITSYFSNHEKLISFDDIFELKSIETVGYRDADGYLVLPKDEEDDYWDKYD